MNKEDTVWQNGEGFILITQELDVEINKALGEANLGQAAQFTRQLLVNIECVLNKEADGKSKFYSELMPRITTVQKNIISTSKDAHNLHIEFYNELEAIYLEIKNKMYMLDLVFKRGVEHKEYGVFV